MIKETIELNVRYAETDQMGFVYYGNYAQYLEMARVAALKKIGISYKSLEETGFLLPVSHYSINYLKAAKYDDCLSISALIRTMPTNKVVFEYEVYRGEDLLATAETTLVFMNEEGKACRPPTFFIAQLNPFFS
tara:strand:+ start:2898 stop:3299 length:402 start_codon:yes stop_codon:yes gene_type:complete